MRPTLFASGLVALAATAIRAAQIPFELQPARAPVARVLDHPHLPAHSLRVVSPRADLCDASVKSYSGYLDVDVDALKHDPSSHPRLDSALSATRHEKDGRTKGAMEHFYFWAFESRNDPKTDPVVLWLNGGPGCSSFTGLLMELGPCNAVDPATRGGKPGTERNPWAWNNNATVIFLDQPVGVGYSYVDWANQSRTDKPPSRVFSAESAAHDASAFLHLLAMHMGREIFNGDGETFPSFHIAGESYAGRYIPLLADQILADNKRIAKHPEMGLQPLSLASVLIGNGITSPKHQYPAYVEYTCTKKSGSKHPLLPKKTCDRMYESIPACLTLVEKCNRKDKHGRTYDTLACKAASDYCEGALASPYDTLKKSPYDWQHPAKYDEEDWVAAFLNDAETKHALGVDGKGPGDKHDGVFVGCSDDVYANFGKTGDGARDSSWAVSSILEQGVRVLTYSGRRDFICNYLGNRAWSEHLPWSGKKHFNKQPLQKWFLPDKTQGGEFKNANNLTYAIVDAAGHFVPHDQPQAALAMFNTWLHSDKPGTL
ncbi:serine carboxypeptidase [Moesziomyces antarcticus]|uniref:Related to Carboxypeptidase Y n=2 Tax=Pseudozyma antarctica TaxID=84753 RepID=A0A5C3FRL6_PSEA2|nr:serine carboxypeptidase [Moesziomyces antarcticus]GAK68298.1 serine carboxypeptidase [Moesziomyces antarcticus]SPO47074.1 related to Carboxypeptidase Y precursor [Moesziomyces antarcticus]